MKKKSNGQIILCPPAKIFVLGFWMAFNCGFVLLGSTKATLNASHEEPLVEFVWDGSAPSIKNKEDVGDASWANLSDAEYMQNLITLALNKWNDVRGSYVQLQMSEDSLVGLDSDDLVHAIVVESNDNASTAAYAAPNIDEDDTSIISDCDISIANRSTTAQNLAYTLIHELGHCLGLGHNHTNYNAIMGYSRMARDLSLGADDKAGIMFLYPDPNYIDGEPKELAACGVVGAHSDANQLLFFILLLSPIILVLLTSTRDTGPA